jgi:F-type H+-transporting ATPase subunit epsilon
MPERFKTMQLKIMIPSETLLDEEVVKVTAEAENGFFCLLPRHIDTVAPLVPGLLSYQTGGGEEVFYAVDTGILVKSGRTVSVSTGNAVRGTQLGHLRETVEKQFKFLDEHEQKALQAANKIEAGLARRFLEIQKIE